jgi:hypothetical protein
MRRKKLTKVLYHYLLLLRNQNAQSLLPSDKNSSLKIEIIEGERMNRKWKEGGFENNKFDECNKLTIITII